MFVFNSKEMKKYIDSSGLKQKVIAEKAGVPEATLSLILQGKRRCEIGEYATICWVLGVNTDKFLQPRDPDKILAVK